MWSPARGSSRHDTFATAASFAVHVLGETQLNLAEHFARQGDGFDSFEWTAGPNGAPTLAGCIATFHCDTYAVHPAGDHSVIIGHVRHAAIRPGAGAGLLFHQGQFGTFAPDGDQ